MSYETQRKTWTTIDVGVTVLAFAASAERIVTVARGADDRTLQVGRFQVGQPAETQFAAVRPGLSWLAINSYHVRGFSIGEFIDTGMWQLDACRDAATWIPLGGKRFMRYGGQVCGGDVPQPPNRSWRSFGFKVFDQGC
ncbi:hypothetical protein ACFFX1_17530 [Dactylosporangium sucinum]|uniref:Uncharacterized protein n=1 Tax=Dactylosporangium sucinum TaxID=1424081 RepID=A0A917X5W9_9ACTN|nr:hypothetical protein [Dactylosporangium sucinum]GGM72994.1 hypothetical protein GCM10007977_088280 [Dactylosporangium sucinum]